MQVALCVMDGLDLWIANGRFGLAPVCPTVNEVPDGAAPYRDGLVSIKKIGRITEIKWFVFAPNWASLYLAMDWIDGRSGLFRLKYFLAGWFEETYQNADQARDRISQVQAKSDVRLWTRVFVKSADPGGAGVPKLLRKTMKERAVQPDYAVECVFDDHYGEFRVERIGARSLIARLWGQAPMSFPCVNGGSYDRTVSAAYGDVIAKGEPRYDHVYASVTAPDNMPFWLPYQRVILPSKTGTGRPSVLVVTEVAPVDIKVI